MLLISRNLIKLARPMRKWIFSMVVIKILLLFCVIYVFKITGSIQGVLYSSGLTTELLLRALAAMLLIALIRFAGNLAEGEIAYRCSSDLRIDLRRKIYRKMLDLEVGYVESTGTSDAVTASVDGIEALETYFSKYLPVLIYSLIAPFILFARFYGLCEEPAIILLVSSLIVLPINQVFKKIVRMLRSEYWAKYSGLSKYYLDSLEGLNTFVLFDADQKRRDDLSEQSWGFRNATMKVLRINFNSVIVSETIIYLTIATAITIIAGSFSAGELHFGRAIFLLMLADTFFSPVRELMSSGHSAMNGVAAAENVFKLLKLKPTHDNREYKPQELVDGESGFVLENVAFRYDGSREILNNINMEVERGNITAIVGQSGCGKSTVANLLMRFYDVDKGTVRLDGRDIRTMPLDELRRKVGIVPQNTYIFSGTIADNLRMAKENVSVPEMLSVLDMVKLGDFVRSEKDGLDTTVGEAGCKLSGGQRQKLGIARAILSGAEIYIFDEATSNVDVDSENDIWDCIGQLSKDSTLVIISHRLSTVQKADCIYVMKDGRIEEAGSHEELTNQQGLYHEMFTEQSVLESYNKGAEVYA